MTLMPAARSRQNLRRLRAQAWPILETAGAALVAGYLAKALLGDRETGFAPIAAVICLGATMGQQRQRALELTGGVVLGVLIADLLVRVLGSGPAQFRLDDGVGNVGGRARRRRADADDRGERL